MTRWKDVVFLDYSLENYHANTYRDLLRGALVGCGFRVSYGWSLDGEAGREWAAKSEVTYQQRTRRPGVEREVTLCFSPDTDESTLNNA
ncbi:MAG: hypothetical protein IAE94_03910 [Chthoniobacterales bacterium]|nr:hypothetical protein [Chthoniobacterales bacterium]